METSRITELFQKDGFLKILSVFIAIILWAYVSFVLNPEVQKEFTNIPVKFNEQALLNSGLALVNNNYTVSFEVKGRRNAIASIDKDRITAVADLSGLTKTGRSKVSVKITGLPSVEMIREPEDIFVEIDKAYSVKKNISVVTKGEPQKGLAVVNATANPATVSIDGPQGLISSIHDVRVVIDVTSLDKSFDTRERVLIIDNKGNEIKGLKSSVETADVTVPIMKVKEIALRADVRGEPSKDNTAERAVISPEKVYVLSNERANSLNELRLEPVDITGADRDVSKKVRIIIPQDVVLAGNDGFANISIHITKTVNKIFIISSNSIQIKDKKQGMDYKVSTDKIDLPLRGSEESINSLSVNSITAALSVNNLPEGQHLIPLSVILPDKVKLQKSDKIMIPVTVSVK